MIASFIIGFHTARIDNLIQTLQFLTEDHKDVVQNSELVLICQDTCDTLDKKLSDQLFFLKLHFEKFQIFNLDLPYMQLPLVTNFGVDNCHTDKVIVLESDRILPAGYFKSVIEQIHEGISITCKNMKKLSTPVNNEEIKNNIFQYKDESRTEENQIGIRNMWSGNTAIWKPDYYKAGKMDEAYIGYGWADSDMTNRMQKVDVKSVYRDEIELHLWHPSATYGSGDQKQMFINNGIRYCKQWDIEYPDWFRKEIAQHKKVLL